jgi:hypothetical protein
LDKEIDDSLLVGRDHKQNLYLVLAEKKIKLSEQLEKLDALNDQAI